MLRKTYSILAVAVTAVTTAACGGTGETSASPQSNLPERPTQQQLADLAEELAHTSLDDALKQRDHFSPLCDYDGYPLPGNINSKESPQTPHTTVTEFCAAIGKPKPEPTTQPTPAPTGQPTPVPTGQPAPACDKEALDQELSNNYGLPEAIKDRAHFRCLCDDKGYPLVGNINSKGTTASEFCKALRDQGLL